ncbi:hypothetical protein ID854_04410 [Xenorhabdus sp. M]|uniref:Uncharacterized protein n=1 Tax=Xenorhabdus szentirmaii TaxID=290112 RepID=A0AAW3YNX4_9GAMM|nr:hypothetical protein [Xenorhabdus sp. M]MBD2799718.1 hypothetical protein [Xenorhabdus sp. M]
MKLKIILTILIFMTMNNYAYSYAGNCDKNLNKIGYVSAVYLGVDDDADAEITFNFTPKGSTEASTISFYNYITGTWSQTTTDRVGGLNARALYALLLTAYTSGSTVKIMRCYSDGLVALGVGNV